MKTWNVDEMLNEHPCANYTLERLTELWAGRERLSLLEILDLPISWADRVWVICRPDALTHEQKAAWLERIVGRTNHTLHDGIPSVEAAPTLVAEAAAAAAAWAARATTWTAWAAAAAWEGAEAAEAAERERQVQDCREILTQEADT